MVAAVAWLVNRAWEVSVVKTLRYTEIVSMLSALGLTGKPEARQRLINEVNKLWIEDSTSVVIKSNDFLNAVEKSDPSMYAKMGALVIQMRRDTLLTSFFILGRRRGLRSTAIKLRSAGGNSQD